MTDMDALMAAADEMAEVVVELQEALSEARMGQIVNYGDHALTAYRAAREAVTRGTPPAYATSA